MTPYKMSSLFWFQNYTLIKRNRAKQAYLKRKTFLLYLFEELKGIVFYKTYVEGMWYMYILVRITI